MADHVPFAQRGPEAGRPPALFPDAFIRRTLRRLAAGKIASRRYAFHAGAYAAHWDHPLRGIG